MHYILRSMLFTRNFKKSMTASILSCFFYYLFTWASIPLLDGIPKWYLLFPSLLLIPLRSSPCSIFPNSSFIFPSSLPSKPICFSVLSYSRIFSPSRVITLEFPWKFCLKSNSGRLWAVCANLSPLPRHHILAPSPEFFWHAVCLTPVDARDYPSILIGLLTSLLMTYDQSISLRQFASFAGSLQ